MINFTQTKETSEISQLLQTLLNNEQLLVACLDHDLNIIDTNFAFNKACESEPSELSGSAFLDIFANSETLNMFKKVIADGTTFTENAREFCLSKGSARKKMYWDYALTPVKDEDNIVTGLIFTAIDVTERVRIARSLHESEEWNKALLELVPVGVGFADFEGRILGYNNQMLRLFGYSDGDKVELNLNEVYSNPDDRKQILEAIEHHGEIYDFATSLKRRDGTASSAKLNVKRTTMDGEPILLCAVHDVSELHEATDKLEVFEALADNAVDATILGTDGNIDYANQAWYKLFGYDQNTDDLHNFLFANCFPEQELSKLKEHIEPAVVSGSWQGTISMKRKDGSIFESDLTVFGVKNKAGNVVSRAAIIRDVTERKRIQEEIIRNRNQLQTLIDNTPAVISVKDLEGRYLLINKQFESLLHVTREEVLRKTVYDLQPKEIADNLRKHDLAAMNQRETIQIEETVIVDGESMSFLSYRAPLLNSKGEPYAMCGVSVDITERKRIEEALIESEERYRALFEYAGHAVLLIDLIDGSIEEFNEQAHVNLGYSREEFEKLTLFDIEIKESVEEIEEHITRFKERGFDSFETKHKTKNGAIRDVFVTATLLNLNGKQYSLSIFVDITERKRIEASLRKTEESLNMAQRIAGIGSWDWNIETNELVWTDEIYRMFGLSKTEFGATYDAFLNSVHPDDREFVTTSVEKALAGEKEYNIEHRIVRPNGTERIVNEQSQVIRGPGNKPIRMVGTVQDITDRKKAEEALIASEEKFRTITEAAVDAIYQLDLEGKVLFMNESGARMFGYNREVIIGMNFGRLFTEERSLEATKLVEKVLSGEPVQGEIYVKHKNGYKFPVFFSLAPLKKDGVIIGFTGISRDISESKAREEEVAKAQRLESVGILAARIAHDFNNILVGVLGNIALAKSEVKPISRIYGLLKEAEKSTTRAAGLTQQLLTFAEGGAPVKETALIGDTIRESVEFALSGSNVVYDLNLADNLLPIKVDHGQFSQVIQNLVLNAEQAMPGGGIIAVKAEIVKIREDNTINLNPGQYVKMCVSDRGVGIVRENMEKVFDPFFTTKTGRSGLGLTTCFSIVKKHGGTMTVDSKVGQGTTIDIYIPASDSADVPQNITSHTGSLQSDSSAVTKVGRVLVMDDEKIIRDLAHKILTKRGYNVDEVSDGKEALELYAKSITDGQPYDAVILDLTIRGGMGGKDTMVRLLELDLNVKAIVCSGYATDPVMADPGEYGFSDVLPKPFKPTQLCAAVEKLIESKT